MVVRKYQKRKAGMRKKKGKALIERK